MMKVMVCNVLQAINSKQCLKIQSVCVNDFFPLDLYQKLNAIFNASADFLQRAESVIRANMLSAKFLKIKLRKFSLKLEEITSIIICKTHEKLIV